ncbi:hypothetical protein STRTUCAR8_00033, partial [Streptomyces turgidiscabies Car8]
TVEARPPVRGSGLMPSVVSLLGPRGPVELAVLRGAHAALSDSPGPVSPVQAESFRTSETTPAHPRLQPSAFIQLSPLQTPFSSASMPPATTSTT